MLRCAGHGRELRVTNAVSVLSLLTFHFPANGTHGERACLNPSCLKFSCSAVGLAASLWPGIWHSLDDGLLSLSAGGSAAPVPTSPACPARMRFRARTSRT